MRHILLVLTLAAVASSIASGQFTDDGVVASASRSVVLPPAEAVIGVSVTTSSQRTLDDVMARVRDLGITLEQLSTVTSIPTFVSPAPGVPEVAGQTTYLFLIQVPLAQSGATLQRFSQTGTATTEYRIRAELSRIAPSATAIADAQRRLYPELFRQAKERAEEMARQAGYSPGRVLAIADTYSVGSLTAAYLSQFNYPMTVAVRIAFE